MEKIWENGKRGSSFIRNFRVLYIPLSPGQVPVFCNKSPAQSIELSLSSKYFGRAAVIFGRSSELRGMFLYLSSQSVFG